MGGPQEETLPQGVHSVCIQTLHLSCKKSLSAEVVTAPTRLTGLPALASAHFARTPAATDTACLDPQWCELQRRRRERSFPSTYNQHSNIDVSGAYSILFRALLCKEHLKEDKRQCACSTAPSALGPAGRGLRRRNSGEGVLARSNICMECYTTKNPAEPHPPSSTPAGSFMSPVSIFQVGMASNSLPLPLYASVSTKMKKAHFLRTHCTLARISIGVKLPRMSSSKPWASASSAGPRGNPSWSTPGPP
eukprot:1140140-Pelagomonas_calceolata.AAC.4